MCNFKYIYTGLYKYLYKIILIYYLKKYLLSNNILYAWLKQSNFILFSFELSNISFSHINQLAPSFNLFLYLI